MSDPDAAQPRPATTSDPDAAPSRPSGASAGGAGRSSGGSADWAARAADDALAEHRRRGGDGLLVCASGISPSGPIHLGNLRELLTPHLVAAELAARGVPVEHVLFLDDHDRLRRLPAGVPAHFAAHLGRPLAAVPDPYGELDSWAERFTAPLHAALAALGVRVRVVSQSARYAAGHYTGAVLAAMAGRRRIAAILAAARGTDPRGTGDAASGEPAESWPYRVYCRRCGADDTRITDYREDSTALRYECARCGADGFRLAEANHGKLAWKVDWPMRWAAEPVAFEAAGADHAAPSSSFGVGRRICAEVFGARPPSLLGYGFVGTRGAAKLSSSAGTAPTPAEALAILEPAMLRWLYARRRPQQAITIDFGTEVTRLYDEWDRLAARVAAGTASAADATAYRRASAPGLVGPRRAVPWRVLTSVLDVTAGDPRSTERILGQAEGARLRLADVEPRRTLAAAWLARHVPPERRTRVRAEPDTALLATLTDRQREGLTLLTAELPGRRDLAALTALVYGIPKRLNGLAADAPADEAVRAAQRSYFTLLYRLLVGADTGPRLPTLLLALGPDRARRLLTP
ncbi:lysine--tRNA ligase [Actinocatenispora comari]|uniref:Lysine--tRNA ligase n=1 Tax=Actinocatenispora comari TaxID=2807577 RepID=A0A8J4EK34_9ACTN|nr:lysine--tRNA ligase [Actinocatenispora comari]GIL26976.1 lysine--tRNA ligase [Actinocatenispora comari]